MTELYNPNIFLIFNVIIVPFLPVTMINIKTDIYFYLLLDKVYSKKITYFHVAK